MVIISGQTVFRKSFRIVIFSVVLVNIFLKLNFVAGSVAFGAFGAVGFFGDFFVDSGNCFEDSEVGSVHGGGFNWNVSGGMFF